MTEVNHLNSNAQIPSRRLPRVIWFWLTGIFSFALCGAICAYIAYDNRMISPSDTPEEFAAHTKELKVVLTSSFIGGGLLGALFGVGGLYVLKKGSADNGPLEHEDEVV